MVELHDDVLLDLIAQGLSQREIARTLKTSDRRIAAWLTAHGLTTRRAQRPEYHEVPLPQKLQPITRSLSQGVSQTGGAGDLDVHLLPVSYWRTRLEVLMAEESMTYDPPSFLGLSGTG